MAGRKNEGDGQERGKEEKRCFFSQLGGRCVASALSLALSLLRLLPQKTSNDDSKDTRAEETPRAIPECERSSEKKGARKRRSGKARALSFPSFSNSKSSSAAKQRGGERKMTIESTSFDYYFFPPIKTRIVSSRTARFSLLCFSFSFRLEEIESSLVL